MVPVDATVDGEPSGTGRVDGGSAAADPRRAGHREIEGCTCHHPDVQGPQKFTAADEGFLDGDRSFGGGRENAAQHDHDGY